MSHHEFLKVATLMHVVYVFITLFIIILLWKLLPGASYARIRFKKWELSGGLAAFTVILLLLLKTGPLQHFMHAHVLEHKKIKVVTKISLSHTN